MMSTLSALLSGSVISSLALTLASQWAVFRATGIQKAISAEHCPPITVLKPLKGVDDGLRENLLSFARQAYPRYEVLLGVENPNDEAISVIREVMALVPNAPFSLVVCPHRTGANPKVSILEALAAKAQYDHYLISDSNVRVPPHYLQSMANELAKEGTGLVTSVIVGTEERTLGATLENLHLHSFIARSTLGARVLLGHSCVIGKSMLMRAADLRAVGGFASVRDVLAEDYVLGKAFQDAGYAVALSPIAVETVNERWPVERFMNRHIRWIQMRRRLHLGSYLIEPLLNPVPLLLSWALVYGGAAICAALLGVLLKMWLDALIWGRLRKTRMPLSFALLVPAKDCLATYLWIVGGIKTTVEWRGNRMRIGEGTRVFPLADGATEAFSPLLEQESTPKEDRLAA